MPWLDYPQGRNPWCPLARRLSDCPRADLDKAAKKEKKFLPFPPPHSLVTVITEALPGQLYNTVKLYISDSYFQNCMYASCNIIEICYEALDNTVTN